MTLFGSSAVDSAVRRRSSAAEPAGIEHLKRKLDDYASFPDLLYGRMKKYETELHNESTQLQFFIRSMPQGKTIVVRADKNETVESLHRRIQVLTGIPADEQRLIYGGKQLQNEHSLNDYSIENDSSLNLLGRMRSTKHPGALRVVDDMISILWRMCRGEPLQMGRHTIKDKLTMFIDMIPKDNIDFAVEYLRVFVEASAPSALVMLYVSEIEGNREYADDSIKHFLTLCRNMFPKCLYSQCVPLLLAFCKLLRIYAPDQPLYFLCRSTLSSMLESVEGNDVDWLMLGREIFPFVRDLADKLSKDLISSMGPLSSDVRDFSTFLVPLRNAILEDFVGKRGPITLPLLNTELEEEVKDLHRIWKELLNTMVECLDKMEVRLGSKGDGNNQRTFISSYSQYFIILKDISLISKLYQGAEEQLLGILKSRKAAFCALVMRFTERADIYHWILDYKDATTFEARRHLALLMFPDVKEDYEEMHEMLIDRSHLLAESFEYIGRANPKSLLSGLFMEFKNEEATGPGVLREWFFLVCKSLFNPENALFVSCPMDHRRFYPNPASKVDPLHLKYFKFSGRMIGLALMHKVQVGVLFDRVFYLQLAGMQISLEDIRDNDPSMYRSCKQILEMDPEFVDSDALGLTFAREIEEFGIRKAVELCPGGKSIIVNSKNRNRYVDLLIEDRFVTSISEQLSNFSQGFADILGDSKLLKFFFRGLELEDLDRMLHGSESNIDIEDWRAHTEYNGYNKTDRQVKWFWKIVERMTEEQRRILLFFWTSIKYLPIEGFCGLASKLYIYYSYEPQTCLPTSHTCFYRLSFPPYTTYTLMEARLKFITQHHFCCGFGTW